MRESLRVCLCAHAFEPARLDRDLELMPSTQRLRLAKPCDRPQHPDRHSDTDGQQHGARHETGCSWSRSDRREAGRPTECTSLETRARCRLSV